MAQPDSRWRGPALICRGVPRDSGLWIDQDKGCPILAPSSTFGLHPTDSRNLLDYWLRLQADELKGDIFDVPEKLVSFLQGHPLAIKIAARLCVTHGIDSTSAHLCVLCGE